MEITEVRIFLRNEEKLKAYVSITLDDAFVVRNLKVVQGKNGIFVAMPSRKMDDGSYKDIAHPINNEMRNMIEEKVLEAYKTKLSEEGIKETPKDDTNTSIDSGTSFREFGSNEEAPSEESES